MSTRAPGNASASVLIIDDDERLDTLLTEYLQRFGFAVQVASHPDAGLRLLKANAADIDIVILDVMLPDMDGFTVCRRIRETSRIPIVMLTARGEVTDRIVGLELGADDYLAKPFEPRELVARMQAVLRRGGTQGGAREDEEIVRVGALEVNGMSRAARLRGQDLALTTAEFELLALLVRNRGRVMTRERILDGTRGIDWESFDRSIDVLVSRLRQKLGDDARRPTFIRTVRGTGYSFIGGSGARDGSGVGGGGVGDGSGTGGGRGSGSGSGGGDE